MQLEQSDEAASVEACIDALEEASTALSHHPPRALAIALAVHLQAVLGVVYERSECSAQELQVWTQEMVRGALGREPEGGS